MIKISDRALREVLYFEANMDGPFRRDLKREGLTEHWFLRFTPESGHYQQRSRVGPLTRGDQGGDPLREKVCQFPGVGILDRSEGVDVVLVMRELDKLSVFRPQDFIAKRTELAS